MVDTYQLALVVPIAEASRWLPVLRGLGLGHSGINLPLVRLHRLKGGRFRWSTGGVSKVAMLVIAKGFTHEDFNRGADNVALPLRAVCGSGMPLEGLMLSVLDGKGNVVETKKLTYN